MSERLIEIDVYPKDLTFKPGESPATFTVDVINGSNRFASFQIEVLPAGADPNLEQDWYKISPEVSTKKPPGDSTQFQVTIFDTPIPGFVGLMNLTVRVFSMELPDEDRQILRLIVEQGNQTVSLKLELPIRQFPTHPGNQLEIPVRVCNPGQQKTQVVLSCLGLEPSWFIEGSERRMQLLPGGQVSETFICLLPVTTFSKIYPFTISASHQYGTPSQITGEIEVLPIGEVKFSANPERQNLPAKWGWLPNWRSHPVTYILNFENASNLAQQVSLHIEGEDQKKCNLKIHPAVAELEPGKTTSVQLVANTKRRWWGLSQPLKLIAIGTLSDPRLGDTDPDYKTLELRVKPILPVWLQFTAGLLLLALLLFWMLRPERHQSPVQSISFNGLGDWIVSGSNDQTMRLWQIRGNRLDSVRVLGKGEIDKAVRVVRYQPVNNNIVAVGLENGQIQLWDLLTGEPTNLVVDRADRVFDLAFTRDSRYLFSGHGDKVVLQWDLENLQTPPRRQNVGLTISTMALVGSDYNYLAIAGRLNQLVFWNWRQPNSKPRPLTNLKPGGQNDYISSLAVAANNANLIAVADNQGTISVWDLSQCLTDNNAQCQPLDTFSVSQPVRSVALSANGCYLVSAGDDAQLRLWPLTPNGQRDSNFTNGITIAQLSKKLNSVDVKVVGNNVLIASGGDDNYVRFYRQRPPSGYQCEGFR
jgi:WD40 repeat protein